jgi:hypothetical protein
MRPSFGVHLDGQGECSTQTAVSIFLVSIFLVSIFLVSIFLVSIFLVSIFLSSAVGEDALQLRYFDGVTQA